MSPNTQVTNKENSNGPSVAFSTDTMTDMEDTTNAKPEENSGNDDDHRRPSLLHGKEHYPDNSSSHNSNQSEKGDDDDDRDNAKMPEPSTRHLIDDRIGQSIEELHLIQRFYATLHRQRVFLFTSLIFVVAWSCLCVWGTEELRQRATRYSALHDEYDGETTNRAQDWLDWLEGAGSKFRMIGILFVFAVVFRFNRCYDRWNQGRMIWGRIISTSLDMTRMASYWMIGGDQAYGDRFCRFVIVLAYCGKALLRGNALSHPDEEGQGLIDRGLLTKEELDDMEEYPGWQTHYCLDMLSAIWIEAHYPDKALMFDQSHKVHSQLFRAIDGGIASLGASIGDAVRVRGML